MMTERQIEVLKRLSADNDAESSFVKAVLEYHRPGFCYALETGLRHRLTRDGKPSAAFGERVFGKLGNLPNRGMTVLSEAEVVFIQAAFDDLDVPRTPRIDRQAAWILNYVYQADLSSLLANGGELARPRWLALDRTWADLPLWKAVG